MIGPGTTPTHPFDVDVDMTSAIVMFITYAQNGRTVVEKSIEDITITPTTVTTRLTQEETLRFAEKGEVKMQIRARMPDGEALESDVMYASVGEVLKEGEI